MPTPVGIPPSRRYENLDHHRGRPQRHDATLAIRVLMAPDQARSGDACSFVIPISLQLLSKGMPSAVAAHELKAAVKFRGIGQAVLRLPLSSSQRKGPVDRSEGGLIVTSTQPHRPGWYNFAAQVRRTIPAA